MIAGQRFGLWTVVCAAPQSGRKNAKYWCVCDCGTCKLVYKSTLVSREKRTRSTSCGCARARPITHGHASRKNPSPTYKIWCGIISRGKHGSKSKAPIGVADRWLKFENFLADMGSRPGREYSVDRKDNSIGYYPDNCRWATSKQQQRNKTNSRMVTIGSKTMSTADWADRSGLKPETIRKRLNEGWNPLSAVFAPLLHQRDRRRHAAESFR